jgi:transposase InsO family protein
VKEAGIIMSKRDVFEFEQIERFLAGQQSRSNTALLLGQTTRTISRKARKVESKGLLGVKHGNLGKRPINKKSDLLKMHVCKLIRKDYFDYNMSHLMETLKLNNGISIPYTTLRRWCHEINIVKKRYKKQKPNIRKKRSRMANEGFLLQMDGSPHCYVPLKEWVLIAAIDDATNDVPAAQFYEAENTFNCMDILEQVIRLKGIPWGIYVDRAGWLGGGKRQHFSEFKRACDELDIEVIFANSPQGKGRIERWFQVPQDRLVAELRTNKITDIKEANRYLKEGFLEGYWRKEKIVKAKSEITKYRPLQESHDLTEIFSMRYLRKINYDNTFKWKNNVYQILNPPGNIVNQEIELRFYRSGESSAYFADRKLEVQICEEIIKNKIS